MKRQKLLALILAVFAAVTALQPTSAGAATSSEIRSQINTLKQEKEEIQEKIEEIQAQYEQNSDEIATIISQKTPSTRRSSCSIPRLPT